MELPAQAVRCVLDGVVHLDESASKTPNVWPNEIVKRIKQLCRGNRYGNIFIESRTYGEVGRQSSYPELKFNVVL